MAKLKPVTKDEIDALVAACQDLSEHIHHIAHRVEGSYSNTDVRAIVASARLAQVVFGLSVAASELTRFILSFMALDEMKYETEAELRKRMIAAAADDAR